MPSNKSLKNLPSTSFRDHYGNYRSEVLGFCVFFFAYSYVATLKFHVFYFLVKISVILPSHISSSGSHQCLMVRERCVEITARIGFRILSEVVSLVRDTNTHACNPSPIVDLHFRNGIEKKPVLLFYVKCLKKMKDLIRFSSRAFLEK